ncbi:MAG: hypothetical protein SGJ27_10515 [Candidatus Melainabacteria bacterium]|nr:hypothetical protein [Candidatus Melainabacteria bacterium]
MKKKTAPKITLNVPAFHHLSCSGHEAHIDVVGTGSENYTFPDAATMVARALSKAKLPQPQTKVEGAGKPAKKPRGRRSSRKANGTDSVHSLLPPVRQPLRIIPQIPNQPDDALGKTLIRGASGLQNLMVGRQLDGLVYENFGSQIGTLHWAKGNMPERYRKGAESLGKQFETITPRFKEAVMGLLKELHKRNPEVPQNVLIKHAVELLREQLANFLFISGVYTESLAQYRDGVYAEELKAINFFYEQAAKLFKHVDPDSPEKLPEGLESIKYQVGDVYLARFTSMSLATIPGSRGPIGIHALQMPFDFQDIIAIMLPLLAHEFRHNLFDDVKGLADEMRALLKDAILAAHKAGSLKFKSEEMLLGSQKVKTVDLMIKLMVDSIGEIDADIAGGVLFSGTAYLYNMMLSFPAMLVRGTPLEKAKKLLRTESSFQLIDQEDGSKALVFEPHPPDYIRAYIVAAGLEEIGFKDEADECRRLADFAVGKPLPTHITWTESGGHDEEHEGEEKKGEAEKSNIVIAFTVEDIKAVAPVVAKAIIRAKLESLGGRSTLDMVDWNQARENKVKKLAEVLVAGKSDVPEDLGSVYATYVGAAATVAYWLILHSGAEVDPADTAIAVNANAMEMIRKLREKAEAND